MPNSEIIERLKKDGNTSQDIYDAMSNSEKSVGSELIPPTPSEEMGSEESQDFEAPPAAEPEFIPKEKFFAPKSIPPRQGIENIEEIAESIINEKMDELSMHLNSMNLWRERTSTEIEAIKQEILRIRNQFENLQAMLIGRVDDYKKNISDVSVEVKTLSKVLEKILEPMTMNIKELSRITERLKK